jgi:hypothetical protein
MACTALAGVAERQLEMWSQSSFACARPLPCLSLDVYVLQSIVEPEVDRVGAAVWSPSTVQDRTLTRTEHCTALHCTALHCKCSMRLDGLINKVGSSQQRPWACGLPRRCSKALALQLFTILAVALALDAQVRIGIGTTFSVMTLASVQCVAHQVHVESHFRTSRNVVHRRPRDRTYLHAERVRHVGRMNMASSQSVLPPCHCASPE